MFKIEDLMTEDFSQYPNDVQKYLKEFTKRLKECIKKELVDNIIETILKTLREDIEEFKVTLSTILENGHKGYNNMSTGALVNLYLDIKGQENFIKLIENISSDLQ